MTKLFKIALVSFAVIAGASAAQAGNSGVAFSVDTLLEQQSKYGN